MNLQLVGLEPKRIDQGHQAIALALRNHHLAGRDHHAHCLVPPQRAAMRSMAGGAPASAVGGLWVLATTYL
jgi:hypothetical protein